jgi:hypothetical protein
MVRRQRIVSKVANSARIHQRNKTQVCYWPRFPFGFRDFAGYRSSCDSPGPWGHDPPPPESHGDGGGRSTRQAPGPNAPITLGQPPAKFRARKHRSITTLRCQRPHSRSANSCRAHRKEKSDGAMEQEAQSDSCGAHCARDFAASFRPLFAVGYELRSA